MKVSVYLGSALECLREFHELAFELGRTLAQAGHTVVYGGADVGTMKDLADGVQSAGGEIIGVFPKHFHGTAEVRHKGMKVIREDLSQLIYVADFAERKKVMEQLSDCCVILPGSFGTLDELFTYACNHAIGEHDKKVYVLNHNGFYTPLRELMENIRKGKLLKSETVDIITFCDSLEDLMSKL